MEEEKKYIYNDKAERIKKMNRFYIGATIFLGILFLLYLWLRMANQNLVNATVYGNTVLIIGHQFWTRLFIIKIMQQQN